MKKKSTHFLNFMALWRVIREKRSKFQMGVAIPKMTSGTFSGLCKDHAPAVIKSDFWPDACRGPGGVKKVTVESWPLTRDRGLPLDCLSALLGRWKGQEPGVIWIHTHTHTHTHIMQVWTYTPVAF